MSNLTKMAYEELHSLAHNLCSNDFDAAREELFRRKVAEKKRTNTINTAQIIEEIKLAIKHKSLLRLETLYAIIALLEE